MCVAAGLTLYEVGSIFTRSEGSACTASDLELLCIDAHEQASVGDATAASAGDAALSCCTESNEPSHTGCLAASLLPAERVGDDCDAVDESVFDAPCNPRGVSLSGDPLDASSSAGSRSLASSPIAGGMDATMIGISSAPFQARARPMQESPGADAYETPGSAMALAPLRDCATMCRRGLPRSRRSAWQYKRGGGCERGAAAPPRLLAAAHPDSVHQVFSDLSHEQWQCFMAEVEEHVVEELALGTWRSGDSANPTAGSCPVAFTRRPC